jgi:predicted nucleic acid-binding protein
MLPLDSEAISALASGPAIRRDRVRALVTHMRTRDLPVATVAAVLAEVVRGRAADSAVFTSLQRERVIIHTVDACVGVRAGQLLGAVRRGSEMAVDAFLVAAADLSGGAIVATVDVKDLSLLAKHSTNVCVVSTQP